MSRCPVCGEAVPLLLADWCSGEGGACRGYQTVGWHVVGYDTEPMARYPGCFVLGDCLDAPVEGFDAYHGSPPCQDYSLNMAHFTSGYPRLIEPVRARLVATGRPWIIENVVGAPLPHQSTLDGAHGVELCGTMFARLDGAPGRMRIQRHRLFETSFAVAPPRGCDHSARVMNPHNADARAVWRGILGPDAPIERTWAREMGVGWMTGPGAREAIPPAMAAYLGVLLAAEVARVAR